MRPRFEVLDSCRTAMGELSLRRRRDPLLRADVYEAKLDDEFLMSSAFTTGEVDLARLALAAAPGHDLDIVVGGLGLAYTATACLAEARVRSMIVVEAAGQVVGWHRRNLLPESAALTGDGRTRLVQGDFFALSRGPGFDPEDPRRRFDAVLLDIDHAPDHLLHPSHAGFYTRHGLRLLTEQLRPAGIFALWSNNPPDPRFEAMLGAVFADHRTHVVHFDNPLQRRTASNTIYVAAAPGTPARSDRPGKEAGQ